MSTYPHTLEDFREAYKATGLNPVVCNTLSRDGECGCPQGVLALHKAGARPEKYQSPALWTEGVLGITTQQFWAFASAFDCGDIGEPPDEDESRRDAHEVGLACRKEFLGLD